jgi:hypothetical protein
MLRTSLGQSVAILLVATILGLPCLISGVPSRGDWATHTSYQYHFSRQFWNGDYYPRWLVDANKGLGSPIFLIQYPLPYWCAALLRPVLRFAATATRESRELGVLCFIVLAASAFAARLWFTKFCASTAATVAAIIYVCLPYFLAEGLYDSVSIGQLFCFIWMPLTLATCHSRRISVISVFAAGVAIGLLILSNPITAFLFAPLMIFYAMACGEQNRAVAARRALFAFASLGVGASLAAIYVIPLVVYRHLFDIGVMPRLLAGFELGNNFAYVRASSLSRPLVAGLVVVIAVVVVLLCLTWQSVGGSRQRAWLLLTLGLGVTVIIPGLGEHVIALARLRPSRIYAGYFPEQMLATALLTLALGVLGRYYHALPGEMADCGKRSQNVLMAASCCSFILMLPWSAFVWSAIPTLSTSVQFPHRLCAVLTLCTAGIVASAIDRSLNRRETRERVHSMAVISSFALAIIAIGGLTWRADKTWVRGLHKNAAHEVDATRDLDVMYRTYISPDHLASFAAIVGTEPGIFQTRSTPVVEPVVTLVKGHGTAILTRRNSRAATVSSVMETDGVAQLGQIYSPLWKSVSMDHLSAGPVLESSGAGLMEFPLSAGQNHIQLLFDCGWPERYGMLVTLLSVFVVVGGLTAGICARIRQGVAERKTR